MLDIKDGNLDFGVRRDLDNCNLYASAGGKDLRVTVIAPVTQRHEVDKSCSFLGN